MSCIFCHQLQAEQVIHETNQFKLVFDINPIQTGHLLIISKSHVHSMTQLTKSALHELIELETKLIKLLEETLPINGVTLASNDKDLLDDGTHFHVHLIPRKKNDGFWEHIDIPQEDWKLPFFLDKLN